MRTTSCLPTRTTRSGSRQSRWLLVCGLSVAVLAGCAQQRPPLYNWGNYPATVYDHLQTQGDGTEKQIAALEMDIEKARAKNAKIPPGLYAHLGMLYLDAGKTDQAQRAWETEKTLYPEGSTFMDFLLAKFKK